jgi:hypothetical protein
MTALTLTSLQSQFLSSLEQPALDSLGDGVVAPGGVPSVIPGYKAIRDLSVEGRTNALNGLKTSWAPLIQALVQEPSWVNVSSYVNGFSAWGDPNYSNGQVRYTKDYLNRVMVSGLLRTPSIGSTNTGALVLPEGYRPAPLNRHIFACVSDNSFCAIEVDESGLVSLRSSPSNDTWVSLELSFIAG